MSMKRIIYIVVLASVGSHVVAQRRMMQVGVPQLRMQFVEFCDAVHDGNLDAIKQLVEQGNTGFSGDTPIGPDRLPAREVAKRLGYNDVVDYFDSLSKNK